MGCAHVVHDWFIVLVLDAPHDVNLFLREEDWRVVADSDQLNTWGQEAGARKCVVFVLPFAAIREQLSQPIFQIDCGCTASFLDLFESVQKRVPLVVVLILRVLLSQEVSHQHEAMLVQSCKTVDMRLVSLNQDWNELHPRSTSRKISALFGDKVADANRPPSASLGQDGTLESNVNAGKSSEVKVCCSECVQ
jgi:hypothetical protein